MTLCCISDTHGRHSKLSLTQYPANVLIHAGDWTGDKDTGLLETQGFLKWFSQQPYQHKILVAGNHERQVESNEERFKELLLAYPDITYLHNSATAINGVNFYGSPYSNEFCGWAFMAEDTELKYLWDEIPEDTNVLITHGPAYGCHDKVNNYYSRDPHVGSKSLHYRKLALQNTLKVHVSGHIHEAYGTSNINGCINICASIVNERYKVVNKPIIVEVQ